MSPRRRHGRGGALEVAVTDALQAAQRGGMRPWAADADHVALAYRRVSTVAQAKYGFSLQLARHNLAEEAARMGKVVPAGYDLQDVDSGASFDAPGLCEVIRLATARVAKTLYITYVDRLARDHVKDALVEQVMETYGVEIYYPSLPNGGRGAAGGFMKGNLRNFAEWQRETIKVTSCEKRGCGKLGLLGLYPGNGGIPKYGHTFITKPRGQAGDEQITGITVDPARRAVVERVIRLAFEGWSADRIGRRLEAEGVAGPPRAPRIEVPFRSERAWSGKMVLSLLRDPILMGEAHYHHRCLNGDVPEDLDLVYRMPDRYLSAEAFGALQAAIDGRRRGRGRVGRDPDTERFPLRGRLRCGHCAGDLSVKVATNGVRAYQCLRRPKGKLRQNGRPACPLKPIPADWIEGQVREQVVRTFRDPGMLRARLERQLRGDVGGATTALGPLLVAADAALGAKRREYEARRAMMAATVAEAIGAGRRADEALASAAYRTDAAAATRLDKEIGDVERRRDELKQRVGSLVLDTARLGRLEGLAAEVSAGLAAAREPDWAAVFRTFGVEGTVWEDADDGVPLLDPAGGPYAGGLRAVAKRRVRVFWEAALPLRETRRGREDDSGEGLVNLFVLSSSSGDRYALGSARDPRPAWAPAGPSGPNPLHMHDDSAAAVRYG